MRLRGRTHHHYTSVHVDLLRVWHYTWRRHFVWSYMHSWSPRPHSRGPNGCLRAAAVTMFVVPFKGGCLVNFAKPMKKYIKSQYSKVGDCCVWHAVRHLGSGPRPELPRRGHKIAWNTCRSQPHADATHSRGLCLEQDEAGRQEAAITQLEKYRNAALQADRGGETALESLLE